MAIVDEVASAKAPRDPEANQRVAQRCLARPALLHEIGRGLADKRVQLVADCAEVMTKVAEQRPDLVEPFADTLFGLIDHKNGRVRWESMHALSLVAHLVPEKVGRGLGRLGEIIREGEGVIVRDYATDAVVAWAATSQAAFKRARPLLAEALAAWESKHAGRVLTGLVRVVAQQPELAGEAERLAQGFEAHPRAGVRKAARAVLKAVARA